MKKIVFISLLLLLIIAKSDDKFLNYQEINDKIFDLKTTNEICDFNNCPLGKGTCFENSCICNIGWITLKSDKNNDKHDYCDYEQKDHSISFFLEFFFPIGSGHFYSLRYLFGLIKLILASVLCLFWCGDICGLRIRFTLNSKWDKVHMGCVLINFLSFTVMHLIDLICFGFNIYKDGNDIDMM